MPLRFLMSLMLFGSFTHIPTLIASSTQLKTGIWRLVVHSPGGDLPIELRIQAEGSGYRASCHNASETVHFDFVSLTDHGQLHFGLSHYESEFNGKLSQQGSRIDGEWRKVTGKNKSSKLPFHADHGETHRFEVSPKLKPANFAGRWQVTFTHEKYGDSEAIAEFRQNGSWLDGTFRTPTGDYRFLQGNANGNELALSCFDGGHMFLFKAKLQENGELVGDFWSRDVWHESWKAVRNEKAMLPDSYALTQLKSNDRKFHFNFPNLQGELKNQDDPAFKGKVRLISLFGSWCPNCNDEAPFLQELYRTYKDQGFVAIGLAFELTGEPKRDIRRLKHFQKRHKITYPILLAASTKDKYEASKKLPNLDKLRAYPTTLLIDRQGKVQSIHTGFSGPGTGLHYEKLKESYHAKIKALL